MNSTVKYLTFVATLAVNANALIRLPGQKERIERRRKTNADINEWLENDFAEFFSKDIPGAFVDAYKFFKNEEYKDFIKNDVKDFWLEEFPKFMGEDFSDFWEGDFPEFWAEDLPECFREGNWCYNATRNSNLQ